MAVKNAEFEPNTKHHPVNGDLIGECNGVILEVREDTSFVARVYPEIDRCAHCSEDKCPVRISDSSILPRTRPED